MKELTPVQYRQRWSEEDEREGRVVMIDVREDHELEVSRLPNAIHIPMGEVPGRMSELDRERPLVVLCRSGGRSGQIVQYLQQQGFEDIYNLAGGINEWAETVDTTLTVY
ncbi:MAG: hypothetical protein JJT93_02730 [Gammaproteobacteria bacterium]|nr:hypothetical protein [Gammaproteobacteria bacterium]TVQ46491.1 MAG: hypothetical protein EA371_10265 [Gammaproteobacteria bacterium]